MTSERSGIYRILRLTAVYDLVQRVVGSDKGVQVFVDEYLKPFDGARVLDIGAGTGLIVPKLGKVEYLGIEPNPTYVEDFNSQYSSSIVKMIAGTTETVTVPEGAFDIVLVLAVLHHVSDHLACEILRYAESALAPNGRAVLLDPVLHNGQGFISRQLVSRDRGKFVRREREYRDLFLQCGLNTESVVRTDLSRFPYSHIITTATRT